MNFNADMQEFLFLSSFSKIISFPFYLKFKLNVLLKSVYRFYFYYYFIIAVQR